VKKLLVLALVGAAGFYAWRRYTDATNDRDLWSELSDIDG